MSVIRALSICGIIVNQIASDGATKNVSAMKQLATISTAEAFGDQLGEMLPKSIKVAFPHPVRSHIKVYIGGEMPHWIKKFANAMENSSKKSSNRDMEFCGGKINLGMIHNVWKTKLSGVNTLRVIEKLTEDHFIKNAHSRMRVHLAAQVLSRNVHKMLSDYCGEDDNKLKEYDSLMYMIERLDTLIDIWNHPYDKKFKRDPNEDVYECIDCSDHKYIKYLEVFLMVISVWKEECTVNKQPHKFMPLTLYKSFTWLVYGLKGVASQIPNGCAMIQHAGGTDDCKHEFANFRQKNSNSTMADTRGMMGQQTGF